MNTNIQTGKLDNHNHELYNHRAFERKWEEVVRKEMQKEKAIFPSDLMTDFGFDALHLYCLYNPVPKTNDDWDEEVVAAAYRFLKRFWALAVLSLRQNCDATTGIRSIRNRLVREMTVCREKGRWRSAPAFFMKACRELRSCGQSLESLCRKSGEKTDGVGIGEVLPTGTWTHTKECAVDAGTIRDLVILLRDLAPVMASELWSRISELPLADAPWPTAGSLTEEGDLFRLPVSVDGKLRTELCLSASLSEEEIIRKGREALVEKEKRKSGVNKNGEMPDVFEKAVYIPLKILNFVSVKGKRKKT